MIITEYKFFWCGVVNVRPPRTAAVTHFLRFALFGIRLNDLLPLDFFCSSAHLLAILGCFANIYRIWAFDLNGMVITAFRYYDNTSGVKCQYCWVERNRTFECRNQNPAATPTEHYPMEHMTGFEPARMSCLEGRQPT